MPGLVYRIAIHACARLPTRPARRGAMGIGGIRHALLRRDQRLGLYAAHVQMRVGASPEDARRWLRRCYEIAAYEDLERLLYPRMTKDNLAEFIDVRGREHLTEALSRGKGALIYGGHARSMSTFCAAMGLLGYAPILPRRTHPSRHKTWLEQQFAIPGMQYVKEKMGVRIMPLEEPTPTAAATAASTLRKNGVVIIVLDAPVSNNTTTVRYLGQPVEMTVGAAMIARVAGAPALDVWVNYPTYSGPPVATIGPPMAIDADYVGAVQKMATRLEDHIRQDPPTWQHWLF
jgi:Kdo2-lipid IVA lauroyltransferase/acyltransferase